MKNKKKIILLFCCFVLIAVVSFQIFYVKYREYVNSSQYWIDTYNETPTTENLLNVCNKLAYDYDIQLLDYLDKLLTATDFESVFLSKDEDITLDLYVDSLIISGLRACVKSDNVESFLNTMEKYYSKISTDDRLSYLLPSYQDNPAFYSTNATEIISVMKRLYETATTDEEKLAYLTELYAFYNSATIKDFKDFELYLDDYKNLINKCIPEINRTEHLNYVGELSRYWDYLLGHELWHKQ